MTGDSLILTAWLDDSAFARFDELRRNYYPPGRNHVPAHLTLFRHLPGTGIDEIVRRLKAMARGTKPMRAQVAGVKNFGEAVAFRIDCNELEALRDELAAAWAFWLLPQDRHFTPHITIQNKVAEREARVLHDALRAGFAPWSFMVNGLILWRYLGGPWERLKEVRFR